MIIQYNLGNFKTGEIKRLIYKDSTLAYIEMGFKLISVAYISNKSFTWKQETERRKTRW